MLKNLQSAITETDKPGQAVPDEERGDIPASDLQPSREQPGPDLEQGIRNQSEISNDNPAVLFEPVAKYPYDLSYACLLIPRFATHYLSGDLLDELYNWLHLACISFGWRLEAVNIQAAYLQWILSVPPAVPPAHIIRVTRQYTSKRIFEEFPRFKKENISGDFWAPGHLVIVGRRPHTPEMISEFIRLTRQQQGMQFIHRR